MKRWLERLAAAIEWTVEAVGRATAWLVIVLVGATVFDVTMRYVFRAGSVAVQELEWHLFAAIFLLAGAYTLEIQRPPYDDLTLESLGVEPFYIPRIEAVITEFQEHLFFEYDNPTTGPDRRSRWLAPCYRWSGPD